MTISECYADGSSSNQRPTAAAAVLAVICLACLVGCQAAATGNNVGGVRQYERGEYFSAVDSFQKALENDPNDPDAYYNLAATYHRMGKLNSDQTMLTQAEGLYHDCLDKCDQFDVKHPECRRSLAVLLIETDRTDKAFTMLRNWSSQDPKSAEPHIELARLFEESGDKTSATRHLEEAVALDAHNARAFAALGRLREESGDVAQALDNYRRAYNLNHYQPGVSHRVAALQRHIADASVGTLRDDTRTVLQPVPSYR